MKPALVGLVALLAACGGLSQSAMAAPPPGNWQGILDADNRPSLPVRLVLDGKGAGQLQFGEPWNCSLALTFRGEQGGRAIFSLTPARSNPMCDRMYPGSAYLTSGNSGAFALEIAAGPERLKGTLQPLPRP
ncbi:MAG TPA: hypothetical protein VGO34_09325 [Alphaproteobacteria bacterium]|jgi:hypothetical protein